MTTLVTVRGKVIDKDDCALALEEEEPREDLPKIIYIKAWGEANPTRYWYMFSKELCDLEFEKIKPGDTVELLVFPKTYTVEKFTRVNISSANKNKKIRK